MKGADSNSVAGGLRILIVDDEKNIRSTLTVCLEGLGAVIVPDDRATPQYLGGFVKSEIEKWAAPIKASGASAD